MSSNLKMHQEKSLGINKKGWFFIGTCWLIIQLVFLLMNGINDQQEANKYIVLSRELVNGTRDFSLHNLWYSGYIMLHALLRMAGLHYKSMYVVQLIFSALSVYYFTRILSTWTRSNKMLIISALLYSTCFIIQQWVSFLYTDSVFSSLLVILIYYLLEENKNTSNKVIFWVLVFLFPLFRPVGFLFLIVACLHWMFTFHKRNIIKIFTCIAYLVFIAVIINRSMQNPAYFYPYHNLDANIICGLPSNLLQYQEVPYDHNTSVASYFWNNPGMATRLFLLRFYKVFSMTRPFFSLGHNLAVAAACIFYYALAAVGLISIIIHRRRPLYVLPAGCLVFCLPTIAFCVEWTGRLSLPVICFVLLMGGVGVDYLVKRFQLFTGRNNR
jgi:hypothetical protein